MGCGIEIVKYLVFIFNLVFSLIGIALLVIGVFFHVNLGGMSDDDTAPWFLIIVGAVVFVISFFGCIGAIRGNSCMLRTYAIFLIILLIIQIGIGTYDFVSLRDQDNMKKEVRESIQDMFDRYNATMSAKEEMDSIQQFMKCCGVDGPDDWQNKLPTSCCKDEKCIRPDDIFKVGCAERGFHRMVGTLKAIGYVLFATCIWEMLGIVCAIFLINSIKNQYRRGVYA